MGETIPFSSKPDGRVCEACAWWVRSKYAAPVKGDGYALAHAVNTDLGSCKRLRVLNLTLTPATGAPLTDMQPWPTTPADFGCNRWEARE